MSAFTFGEDGLLTGQLLQDLGRSGQSIARLAHSDVDAQLADAQRPHDILCLVLDVVLGLLVLDDALHLAGRLASFLATDAGLGRRRFVGLGRLLL